MSQRRVKRKLQKVSLSTRERVAKRIATRFNSLDPESKRKFVDETLTVLVNMSKKQMGKLLSKFVKKGKPSVKDLETINQLVVVFLYSVKPEYQYHYASMIFKGLNLPIPKDLPEKLQYVRKKMFIHADVSPETYKRLYNVWERLGVNSYDEFFNSLLERIEKG